LVRMSEDLLVCFPVGVAVAMRRVMLVLNAWAIDFVVGWYVRHRLSMSAAG